MARPVDYFETARTQPRAAFVRNHPYFFLVGQPRMEHARQPRRTDIFDVIDPSQDSTGQTRTADLSADDEAGSDGELMILAVRKVQETFPSMITVGRTHNNDLCIPDQNIY